MSGNNRHILNAYRTSYLWLEWSERRYFRKYWVCRLVPPVQGSICVPRILCIPLVPSLFCSVILPGMVLLFKKKNNPSVFFFFFFFAQRPFRQETSFKLEMVINIITGSWEELIETAGIESDKIQIVCYLIRRAMFEFTWGIKTVYELILWSR